jgi:hypothetical protein
MGLLGWLLALYPGFGLTIMMAKVMFDEEEAPGGSLEYMMWPFDFSRFNEVASLFFVEDMSRLAYLTFKKHAPGSSLTRKEEKEYEVRKRNMIYALGPLGKMKKNADREERRKKKGPPKPPQPERPPAPPSP